MTGVSALAMVFDRAGNLFVLRTKTVAIFSKFTAQRSQKHLRQRGGSYLLRI